MEITPVSLSAYTHAVTELPREEKEKLLRALARECGYLLEPAPQIREDFQRKLFLDLDDD